MDFGGFSLADLLLVAACALGAQTIGGLAGYGTGLLMPLVLVPMIGAEAVVPVIALSALITNPTRVITFRHALDLRRALIVVATALPTVAIGAWGFTMLNGPGAAIFIGVVLMSLVPLRRFLKRLYWQLSERGLAMGGVGFGLLMGSTTGGGVVLIAMLLATGLTGKGVIATDAAISFVLGIVKTGVFWSAGDLPPRLWLVALIIGVMATPGTLLARWLTERFAAGVHEAILEATIVVGGLILVARGAGLWS